MLGVGNLLLTDEGFGVHVVTELKRRYVFAGDVQLLDGGTVGLGLLNFLLGTEKLIILDAIEGQAEPGTVFKFTGTDVQVYFDNKISLHELGVKELLTSLEVCGSKVDEVVIIGVQPVSLELGLELTPLLAACMDAVMTAVIAQLQSWGIAVDASERF